MSCDFCFRIDCAGALLSLRKVMNGIVIQCFGRQVGQFKVVFGAFGYRFCGALFYYLFRYSTGVYVW